MHSRYLMLLIPLGLGASPLGAQPTEQATTLVVKVLVYADDAGLASDHFTGSGIIVGAGPDSIFIATARHVLDNARDSAGIVVGKVRVAFQPPRKRVVRFPAARARLISADSALPPSDLREAKVRREAIGDSADFALIAVQSRPADPVKALEFNREGSARVGDQVYAVGCAIDGLGCWQVPPVPDVVAVLKAPFVRFQTGVVEGGHSGGALFNRWGEVVGMITSTDGYGTALKMDYVLDSLRVWKDRPPGDTLKAWQGPLDLKKATIPREGHRTMPTITYLWSTSSTEFTAPGDTPLAEPLSSRVPSLVVTLSRRISSSGHTQVSWRISALRLAPTNLAVTAGLFGLEGAVRTGRFSFGVFVEVGGVHVESQSDEGGYFISDPEGGPDQYVPFFVQEKDDGLGAGFGATMQLTVFRWLVLEGVLGHWDFNKKPGTSQVVPDVFAGAGVRFPF